MSNRQFDEIWARFEKAQREFFDASRRERYELRMLADEREQEPE